MKDKEVVIINIGNVKRHVLGLNKAEAKFIQSIMDKVVEKKLSRYARSILSSCVDELQ